MIIKKIYPILLVLMFAVYGLLPLSAMAKAGDVSEINLIINNLGSTATRIIQLLFVIASVVFLWGVIAFIAKADDENARKKGKVMMTWGIVGMAVMASAWGLTALLVNYFGTGGSGGLNVTPKNLLPGGLIK